jgi:alpha-glucoside transport system substrate-binding protein
MRRRRKEDGKAVFTRPRQALVIASALALTFSATACSSSDSNNSNNADSPECAAYEAYQGSDGEEVSIYASIREAEADILEQSWKQFEDCTGITIDYEGSGEFEAQLQVRVDGGNAPDISFIPQPGLLARFAEAGKLKPASAETKAMAEKNYPADWLKYSTVKGTFYGAPLGSNVKSFVWYSPKTFKEKGWTVPTTWADMLTLTEKIAATGEKPWCAGIESGEATGWPATDWIEDLMLRMQPPEAYDKWTTNELKFDDPAVVSVIDEFGKFAKNEAYVDGGVKAVASTDFRDSPKGLFAVPPKCYMHHQASFIPSFFPEGTKMGQDADFFYMPTFASHPELGKPVLGAGTLVTIAKDSKPARAFVEFLKTPIAHEVWMAQSSFLTPYKGVNTAAYANEQMKREGEILTTATTFRFDGSDLMPGKIGAGAFWTGMVDFVGGKSAQDTAKEIQSAWDGIK